MGLDQVLSDLEGEIYSCQTLVVPACAVNAPHRRDRVWIVAHSDRFDGNGRRYSSGPICRERSEPSELFRSKENVAYSDSQGGCGGPAGSKDATHVRESSRCAGGGNWDIEPELGRVAHGVPNRVDRLKQLGNAVVPQVVEQIGRAIMKIERE